jgi:glutathione S-transferase
MELYQAEWCPHSHKVRQRLTELGVEVLLRQVPAEQEDRDELERATGGREIPALVADDGSVLSGEEEILPWLGKRFEERPDAPRHRAKARAEVPEFEEVAGQPRLPQ